MTHPAALCQIEAADPLRSTWLTANAGSGKTRVLTDRVARLLLSGVAPQNILCLTYTKAAAGEMQNRLFARLGGWAMLGDAELSAGLRAIGADAGGDQRQLARARRLFASAIETPGGLKIQTIHAFCASILRQFPLEAGVSPAFREMDERESKLLLRELFDEIAAGPDAAALHRFARHCPGDFEALLSQIAKRGAGFDRIPDRGEVMAWFGQARDATRAAVVAEVVAMCDDRFAADLATSLAAGGKNDAELAGMLRGYALAGVERRFAILSKVALTDKGTIRKTFDTKPARDRLGPLHEPLMELMAAVQAAHLALLDIDEGERTFALHDFSARFCGLYARRKRATGALDFDDLIRRALAVLNDPEVAAWVLFRLDNGIDHILVDEAQDTSPDQWAVVEKLAQEFAAGFGSRPDRKRTIFAVGDPKQSIYSFQGADPAEFARMRDHFAAALRGGEHPLATHELRHSFRSSPLVLDLVDRVFQADPTGGIGGPTNHMAFHETRPGRVRLWPLIPKPEREELPEWWDPRDRTDPRAAAIALADRIAAEVRRLVDTEQLPTGDGSGWRRVEPGDILILVRRRNFIMTPLILAMKRHGLDVAGSDQIDLASDLAVRDLVALLSFIETPSDSLSLAAVLRSPLFGLGEAALFDLAHRRGRPDLWEALLDRRAEFAEIVGVLEDLRDKADFLRPYELLERVLVRHRGRQRMIARLGAEVEESIDVLLQQALAYEQGAVPSMTGFLAWLDAEGVTVKRQAEVGQARVRVMTVHAAKGLESEIVILPDTAVEHPGHHVALALLPGGQPVFRPTKAKCPPALARLLEDLSAAEAAERDRLFYVALTRARNWLIVCGAGEEANPEKLPCWHDRVRMAMVTMRAHADAEGGMSLDFGTWPDPSPRAEARAVDAPVDAPDWLHARVATPARPVRALAPSALDLGPVDAQAVARGLAIHRLIEHLPAWPEADRAGAATALLAGEGLTESEAAELAEEAARVLAAPDLAHLFGPDALAEVPLAATVPGLTAPVAGRVDRLVRRDGTVTAIDLKSHRVVPASAESVPGPILAQMGAYLLALREIYPSDRVEVAILWTRTPCLMHLPHDIVTQALRDATKS